MPFQITTKIVFALLAGNDVGAHSELAGRREHRAMVPPITPGGKPA
jgi:hypothetical protein